MWDDATFFVFAGSCILRILAGKGDASTLPNPRKIESAEEQ